MFLSLPHFGHMFFSLSLSLYIYVYIYNLVNLEQTLSLKHHPHRNSLQCRPVCNFLQLAAGLNRAGSESLSLEPGFTNLGFRSSQVCYLREQDGPGDGSGFATKTNGNNLAACIYDCVSEWVIACTALCS